MGEITLDSATRRGWGLYRPAISGWARATIRRCNSVTVAAPIERHRRLLARPQHGLVPVDRLETVAEGLAADHDAVLDDLGGFAQLNELPSIALEP